MQKKLLLMSTALAGSFAFGLVGARATSVTFTNPVNSYSGTGSVIDGAFDISSFIGQEAASGNGVALNNATIQLYGYSSPTNNYTSTYVGSFVAGYATYYYVYYYDCGWSSCSGYGSYTYAVYGSKYDVVQGDNQPDQVLADFGDQQLTANDSQPPTNSYYTNTYTQAYITTGNDFGNVSTATNLSLASMNELLSTSMLDYALNVTDGGFDSSGLSLTLDYSLIPINETRATPLPPAALLFASGLGGAIFLNRRRRKKKGSATG